MKNIILTTFILTVLTILSCQNEKKEESNNSEITKQKGNEFSPIESKKEKTAQIVSKDSLDIIFIGKTTEELNKYNFYTCLGAILGNNSENEEYAICIYSLHRNDCHKGRNKIVIEKFINYYEQGKANFVVKDELIVTSDFPKKCYSDIRMKLDRNKTEKNYLIEYEDNSKEIITKIYKLWEIDLDREKFIEIELPKNIQFYNPDYEEGL